MFSLYIHIPFCQKKCLYCDFPSYSGKEHYMARYTDALLSEMKIMLEKKEIKKLGQVKTIYIGGGTPTALPSFLLFKIIENVERIFFDGKKIPPRVEFTVEANPNTTTRKYLEGLFARGVNRLSFGVQSFSDKLLAAAGRLHQAKDALRAISTAKSVGLKNISLDLIYGLPTQTLADLQNDLAEAIKLEVQHISIYGLQLEENTPFFALNQKGLLLLPTEDETAEMYEYLTDFLPKHKYHRYEISSFSKKGFFSQHNLAYWEDKPYLGIGAGASSYYGDKRYQHTRDVKAYINSIATGKNFLIDEEKDLSNEERRKYRIEEFAFLALRTARGIDIEKFQQKFGINFFHLYAPKIEHLEKIGLIETYQLEAPKKKKFIHLTPKGMQYGNYAFGEFLL